MTRRKYVDVTVSWCYDTCVPTAKVSLADWELVLRGKRVSESTTYWYEGSKYNAYFHFNHDGFGSLEVASDDGFTGFVGNIEDAEIVGGQFPGD